MKDVSEAESSRYLCVYGLFKESSLSGITCEKESTGGNEAKSSRTF